MERDRSESSGAGRRPLVIGLLGGIAAGKSTVAGIFEESGFGHLDADAVAREITATPEVTEKILQRFGPGVRSPAGAIDRPALARVVFADAAARRDLEALIHPPVRAALLARLREAADAGRDVVLDVPLALESGWLEHCDHVVFLDAPEPTRQARAAQRGWPADELAKRESHQAPLEAKRAASTFVIDTGGEIERTRAQVADIVGKVRRDAATERRMR